MTYHQSSSNELAMYMAFNYLEDDKLIESIRKKLNYKFKFIAYSTGINNIADNTGFDLLFNLSSYPSIAEMHTPYGYKGKEYSMVYGTNCFYKDNEDDEDDNVKEYMISIFKNEYCESESESESDSESDNDRETENYIIDLIRERCQHNPKCTKFIINDKNKFECLII